MDSKSKMLEIQQIKIRLKAELPRVLKEIEVYEKAVNAGYLKQNTKPSLQS